MQVEEQVNKILLHYGSLVNSAIEKIIPKSISDDYLRKVLGEPLYRFEILSIQRTVADPFWDLIDRGGKRWRPVLSMLVYEALGGDIHEFVEYAAIPEMIHNATLIVDDVEDMSLMRRGKPCIHKIYGEDVAINAGNTLYYLPLWPVYKLDENKRREILESYVKHMTALSIGQAMDIAWHRGLVDEITEEQYMQMCAFKTGSVAKFAVEIACILAEADNNTRKNLAYFGETISVAFQIQDDLLNLIGDEKLYGKEIGGDITEGKRTLMVVYALRHLNNKEKTRLRDILNMHTSDQKLIREAIELIKKSGAIEYAKKAARDIMLDAWAKADESLPESDAKKKLKLLSEYLIERSR